jgi:integrase/recombinase XerD
MAIAQPAPASPRPARKSPLRTAGLAAVTPAPAGFTPVPDSPQRDLSGAGLRQLMISEYTDWLRSVTSKKRRPFQEGTIRDYAETARVLDRWMTGQDNDGDFTVCDTALLNRFFSDYFAGHGQGGTNTRQRNLRHLFTWLEKAYGHPHPYTDDLNRYSPVQTRPSTLAQEFIADMLKITGGGQAHDFARARDHAMIRMLTEGVRRTELVEIRMGDLSADLIAQPFVRVVPLKGARDSGQGRVVPLSHSTSRAITVYLRARHAHRQASSPALWLGTRHRGPLTGSGLYRMLKQRAVQAGYDPDVHPHQFRHTFANDWQRRGVASDATFRRWREEALPGPQQPRVAQRVRQRGRQSLADLRCQDHVASDSTMKHPVRLRQIAA